MRRVLIGLLVIAALTAGCGQSPAAPTFALAIQNGSDLTLRLNVVVAPGQKPSRSLEIPAGSGVLQTAEAPMGWTGSEPVPVAVELYTETCALIDTITVGRGDSVIFSAVSEVYSAWPRSFFKSSGAMVSVPCG